MPVDCFGGKQVHFVSMLHEVQMSVGEHSAVHDAGAPGLAICKCNVVEQQCFPGAGRSPDAEEEFFRTRIQDALSY